MTDAFARLPRGRVLQYHNVTPAHFFAPYEPAVFRLAALGRQELSTLAGHTDAALGDSEYNRQELETLGFGNTGVFPIAVDFDRILQAPRQPALGRVLSDELQLPVRRPHRPQQEDRGFHPPRQHYKRYVDTDARFIFVGKTDGIPRYYDMVRALLTEFRCRPISFIFTGRSRTTISRPTIGRRVSISRSRNTRASVCTCSKL
jgi:hypothetical protein